jgi:hypothetical protein
MQIILLLYIPLFVYRASQSNKIVMLNLFQHPENNHEFQITSYELVTCHAELVSASSIKNLENLSGLLSLYLCIENRNS